MVNNIDLAKKKCTANSVKNLKKGNYFGEIALINCCPRTATVITTAYTTFAVIEKSKFL